MSKKSGCPSMYFKTKDGRCANVVVRKLISDKGLDYGIWVRILTPKQMAYAFRGDWGLYKEEKIAKEMAESLIKDMKNKGLPELMKETIERGI